MNFYYNNLIKLWGVINMESAGVNILILGKTGVGKSSFCNYIFGENLFRTGEGRPVTNWNEHFKYEKISHEGFNLNLFDSVGIETDNLTDWKLRLNALLEERNDMKSEPNQWIHGAFYLINTASARIEPTEIDLINSLSSQSITISIILTNADSATDEAKSDLISSIKSKIKMDRVNIHEVCSVNIRKRLGSTVQFGKDEVLHSFLKKLDENLCEKSLSHAVENIHTVLLEAENSIKRKIIELDLGIIKVVKGAMQDNLDSIFNIDNGFLDELSEEYKKYANGFDCFIQVLGYSGNSLTSTSMDSLMAGLDSIMSNSYDKIEQRLNLITDGLDSDSTWEQLKSIFKVGGVLLTLESTMIEIVDDMFRPIYDYLYDAMVRIEETGSY